MRAWREKQSSATAVLALGKGPLTSCTKHKEWADQERVTVSVWGAPADRAAGEIEWHPMVAL